MKVLTPKFCTHLNIPAVENIFAVEGWPDRQGSGLVRDLPEAAKHGNWKAVACKNLINVVWQNPAPQGGAGTDPFDSMGSTSSVVHLFPYRLAHDIHQGQPQRILP